MQPILLVEDNPNDIALARVALRKTGVEHRLVVVRDGEEAIEYVFRRGRYADRDEGSKPSVMLLDLKMPLVSGFDVLRVLRQEVDATWLPIVIMTSSTSESDIAQSYAMGANAYVVKPFAMTHFVSALQKLSGFWLDVNRTASMPR